MILKVEDMEKRITNESTASYSAKAIKKLPFIAVAASLIFLFNANVNIIDILPDFIGYIILSIALVKFGDLNSEIEASARFFRYMICVDLSKYAALMWVFGTTKSDMQNNAILLVAFVYAVIEVILLTIAFKKLFEGLAALGYTNQNTSILGSARAGGRTNTDKIRGFTFFFIFAKAAFSVLPEFAVLTTVEYTENSFVMYLYEYIGIMRLLAFFFGTIIGIVWIIGIFRYFKRIASDKVFVDSLILRYNTEIISKDGIFVRRNTEIASLIYIFALVFMFDLKFESVNIIPDFIAAILCLFGIVSFIRVSRSKCYFLALPAVIYAITSIIAQYVEIGFFDKYYYGAVFRAPEVYNAYVKM